MNDSGNQVVVMHINIKYMTHVSAVLYSLKFYKELYSSIIYSSLSGGCVNRV